MNDLTGRSLDDILNRLAAVDATVSNIHTPLAAVDEYLLPKNGPRLDARNKFRISVDLHFYMPFESPFHAISRSVFKIRLGYSSTKL